ncbi:MAG: hypothetical protein OEO83_16875 [Alphaproteobacteria bacterium]|nr:hypothetical protein [Alphaproteobacteria bacterium]
MTSEQAPFREVESGVYETDTVAAVAKEEPNLRDGLLLIELIIANGKRLHIPFEVGAVEELRAALSSYPESPDFDRIG